MSPASSESNNKPSKELATCFHAGFLLNLFFDPEDGGNIFLKMSVDFQWTTSHYIPEDGTLYRVSD
jgi:hypothetical protein